MTKFQANSTELQVATDVDFENVVNEDDSSLRTRHTFNKDDLPYGVNLFTRVRYVSDELGTTDWSPTISFHIEVPANTIGVCIDQAKGTVMYVDINGNEVPNYLWDQSGIFRRMSMVTLDNRASGTFLKIPKFYIRTATAGITGTITEGKLCYWVSDIKLPGYRTHLAFKRSPGGGESEYIYLGVYAGSLQTVEGKQSIGSNPSKVGAVADLATLTEYIENRNSLAAGELGYRGFDIYDAALLKLLGLVMYKSTDFQTIAGTGTDTVMPSTGTSDARMIFQGDKLEPRVFIADLWRTYQTYLFKIKAVDGVVQLEMPYSSDKLIPTGTQARYTMPKASGYIASILDCPISVGSDLHDIMELFLPRTVIGSEILSAYKDYYVYQSGVVEFKTGGSWKETTNWCGPFFTSLKPYEEVGGYTEGTHYVESCPYCWGQDKVLTVDPPRDKPTDKDAVSGDPIREGDIYKWYSTDDDTTTNLTTSTKKILCPHARAIFHDYSSYPHVHTWNKSASTFRETPCGLMLLTGGANISSNDAFCPKFGYNLTYAEKTNWLLGGNRAVLAGNIYERNRKVTKANNMVVRLCKS